MICLVLGNLGLTSFQSSESFLQQIDHQPLGLRVISTADWSPALQARGHFSGGLITNPPPPRAQSHFSGRLITSPAGSESFLWQIDCQPPRLRVISLADWSLALQVQSHFPGRLIANPSSSGPKVISLADWLPTPQSWELFLWQIDHQPCRLRVISLADWSPALQAQSHLSGRLITNPPGLRVIYLADWLPTPPPCGGSESFLWQTDCQPPPPPQGSESFFWQIDHQPCILRVISLAYTTGVWSMR